MYARTPPLPPQTHPHTHTHTFTSTHSDYHVNGALCNRWMCQTRDGAFTFGRWMDCGGRKYGGGLSGLRKLVLFAFYKITQNVLFPSLESQSHCVSSCTKRDIPSAFFFFSPPSISLCFSLSCLWHLHVKRQQKSCFNLYPWLIVCAERMVALFSAFYLFKPPFTISSQHWLHLNNESNWTWLNITIHSQSISPK